MNMGLSELYTGIEKLNRGSECGRNSGEMFAIPVSVALAFC